MVELRRKVQVWVVSKDLHVLILKTNAGRGAFWQPVTGSLEHGETYEAGAAREAFEETGLREVTPPEFLNYEFQFENEFGTHFEKVFFIRTAQDASDCKVRLDPNEHSHFLWAPFDKVLTLLHFESNREAFKLLTGRLNASIIANDPS
jgi:8-oxo-dGTP pyrophosphatase MutT (NUDIX family)